MNLAPCPFCKTAPTFSEVFREICCKNPDCGASYLKGPSWEDTVIKWNKCQPNDPVEHIVIKAGSATIASPQSNMQFVTSSAQTFVVNPNPPTVSYYHVPVPTCLLAILPGSTASNLLVHSTYSYGASMTPGRVVTMVSLLPITGSQMTLYCGSKVYADICNNIMSYPTSVSSYVCVSALDTNQCFLHNGSTLLVQGTP